MAKESTQHKLDRVRRPRVQITYDVETNGAMAEGRAAVRGRRRWPTCPGSPKKS